MEKNRVASFQDLPLLALRGLVVFPNMMLHFDVGRRKSVKTLNEALAGDRLVFLVCQKDVATDDPGSDDLYRMGVVARIHQVVKMPEDNLRVMVEGLYRARLLNLVQVEPTMTAHVRPCREHRIGDALLEEALMRECRNQFARYAENAQPLSHDVLGGIADAKDAGYLADFIASNIVMPFSEKQVVLNTVNVETRVEKLLNILAREAAVLELENRIQNQVQESMDKSQKEYYLREQMHAIAEELGEEDDPLEESEELRQAILELQLPEETEEKLLKECRKMAKMPVGSHEATVVRNYLDTCLSLPWNRKTADVIDLKKARRVLDRDHYGLDKVKERILEILAVRRLTDGAKGQVICLVGPPGVGKTSVAKSVAAAMGRKYVRVSLGGVRDEAEIRGHRKTYIGAMPGRIIQAIRQANVSNPLILLDEIDKMGNDFHGDPSAAMLEVLDGEQNFSFCDHYVEVPFDLSQVLFITTANDASAIPEPLYDRMDVLELPSYTEEEKFHIAKEHLIKKQLKENGLTGRQLKISDSALRQIIRGYTREAGVRTLERRIGTLCRKTAAQIVGEEVTHVAIAPQTLEAFLGPQKFKEDVLSLRDEIGVVNGLAWTSVGGELLTVEVAVLDGTGKVELTGSLGDVMKESAQAAISYVRAHAAQWHMDADFYKNKDIHVHVPEGAVPKDGPSAGVTMATAIVSALTGIPVRHDVAMTGEITLRGRVLPIGGLKEKTMAAYTHHMKTVIVPEENESDLAEIVPVVRENVEFVTANHLNTVLEHALVASPEAIPGTFSHKKTEAAAASVTC